jgi:molecular chaperone GrpE
MSNIHKQQEEKAVQAAQAAAGQQAGSGTEMPVAEPVTADVKNPLQAELEAMKTELDFTNAALKHQEEQYLRLAAEYDNFRRRTQKEKSTAWSDAQAETALAFLPIYDNLERALKQTTADKAYAKGVEMTMVQLKSVLEKLGICEIPTVGKPFDPALHNAIMHVEDETLGENIITESFQTGFKLGDKIIRVAMVKVAN